MQVGHAASKPVIAWWLDVEGVGESLQGRFQVPKELPPKLRKLIRKLDAIEGNQCADYEQSLEARTIGGVK
jgi:hypothetical protein